MKRSLLYLLAVVALTGCGSSDAVSPEPVAEAAAKTAAVPTSYMSMETTSTIPGIVGPVTMTGEGAFDNERELGWMTLDMSALAKTLPQGQGVPTDPALWKTKQVMDFSEGLILYMKFPFLAEALETDKWVRIDFAKAGRALGLDLQQLMQPGQENPTQQLDQLRAITDDLEEVGRDTVRGVETTHYRGTVDLREYEDLFPEDERAEVRKTVDRLVEMMGSPTYPVDVWIDDENLVRRMSFEFTMRQPGAATKMAMTMEFFDFGRPVDVTVPAAADTIDLADLEGAG